MQVRHVHMHVLNTINFHCGCSRQLTTTHLFSLHVHVCICVCIVFFVRVYMQGFNADAIQPRMRYGDSIYLLPEGMNAIAAFAGSEDGRPWVEFLHREVLCLIVSRTLQHTYCGGKCH